MSIKNKFIPSVLIIICIFVIYQIFIVERSTESKFCFSSPIIENNELDPRCDGLCAESFYNSYVSKAEAKCDSIVRLGSGGEGGWSMCTVGSLLPKAPCLAYSFGIRTDWSFDDTISTKYNCTVRAFDPSIKQATHKHSAKVWFYNEGIGGKDGTNELKWNLSTLASFRKRFNEADTVIDYLKIDIEHNEWAVLETALADGSLLNVRQLGLEVHTREWEKVASRLEDYRLYIRVLLGLRDLGFQRWTWHLNPQSLTAKSLYSGKTTMCCHEFIFYNEKYATLPSL